MGGCAALTPSLGFASVRLPSLPAAENAAAAPLDGAVAVFLPTHRGHGTLIESVVSAFAAGSYDAPASVTLVTVNV